MAKATISCVNLKGGVGKTALAVNLAAIAGEFHNKKTLLIDMDPQTNATFWCIGPDKWQAWAASNGTIADLFGRRGHTNAENRKKTFDEVVCRDVFTNVDLIPSHIELFTLDLDLAAATSRERLIKKALANVMPSYDLVICDCPPNLTLPTQNALSISTHYVVPVSLDYLSSIGVSLLLNRVKEFAEDADVESLECAGIAISRVGRPAYHREKTKEQLKGEFQGLVLPHMITERVVVDQAASTQKPVHRFPVGADDAASEFKAVAAEILRRAGVL